MKLFTVVLVLCLSVLNAQTVLFEDDFTDGNADGWIEWDTLATYEVNGDLRYQLSYSGADDVDGIAARGDLGSVMSTNNYSVRVKAIAHSPTDYIGVGLRLTQQLQGYVAYLRILYNDVCICRHESEYIYDFIGIENIATVNYDEPYWIRFKCENEFLMVKVWQGQSYEEPDEWLLVTSDTTYSNNGCAVLASANHLEGACDTEFDNVQVIGYPTSLEQSTWGQIKAIF